MVFLPAMVEGPVRVMSAILNGAFSALKDLYVDLFFCIASAVCTKLPPKSSAKKPAERGWERDGKGTLSFGEQ